MPFLAQVPPLPRKPQPSPAALLLPKQELPLWPRPSLQAQPPVDIQSIGRGLGQSSRNLLKDPKILLCSSVPKTPP